MAIISEEKIKELNFALIGAGKVGSAFSLELFKKGIRPVQIVNRNLSKAEALAKKTNCEFFSPSPEIHSSADFILIAVNDDSIPGVIDELGPTTTPVFHCSGSTSIEVFPSGIPNHGVIYPLQSFSTGREVNFSDIPFLIESSNENTFRLLKLISRSLTSVVIPADSTIRLKCHIAAVFASNFSYHLIVIARDYLNKNKLSAELLNPLIKETLVKLLDNPEADLQTGPAVREDYRIIQKHQEVLKNDPSLQKLYTFVSESIIHTKNAKRKKLTHGEL